MRGKKRNHQFSHVGLASLIHSPPSPANVCLSGTTSQGCAGAVKRVVTRLEGVTDIDIDLSRNKVVVKYNDGLTEEQIITAIAKTGKATSLWS